MKTLDAPNTFWNQVRALQASVPLLPGTSIEEDLERLRVAHVTSLGDVLRLVGDSRMEPETRAAACWLLGRLGKRSAVPSLLSVLTDPNPEVRRAAVQALGVIGHTWAVLPIAVALGTDSDTRVREAAAFALGLIANKRALEPLLEAATNQDEDARVRSMAVEQLGNLGERTAIPYLIMYLHDVSPEVRFWSIYALSELGDSTVIPELQRVASADESVVQPFGSIASQAQEAIKHLQRKNEALHG